MVHPLMNKNVVKSLACQHHLSTGEGVGLNLLSKWLQVSKPTAKKIIEKMGILSQRREHYRANVQRRVYTPTAQEFKEYHAGNYRDDYKMFTGMMWRNGE